MYKCGSFLTFSKIFIENMAEAEIIMNILQSLKREARFFHCKRAKSSNFNEEFQSIPFFFARIFIVKEETRMFTMN